MRSEDVHISPIVYLFCEGDTELDYLEQITKTRDVQIVKVNRDSSPAKLLRSAFVFAIGHAGYLRDHPQAQIWVVFDYDGKQQEIQGCADALRKCNERCAKTCEIRDFNRCEFKDVLARINVAYMAPCIELWGLICTEKGSALKTLSLDRHELQRQLHVQMPKYSHKSGARFDLTQMTQTNKAIARAKQWTATHGSFPDCINASYYAGIAPLVEWILACAPKQSASFSPWRRK